MNISKSEDGIVTQQGNVTRVSFGAPVESPVQSPIEAVVRLGNQVHRAHADGRVEEASGVTRYQSALDVPVNAGSIMATKRTEGGRTTVQLIPGVEASRTDIQSALREGLLVETLPGYYMDASASPHVPPQRAPTASPDPEPKDQGEQSFSFMDKNDLALWNEDIAPIEQRVFDGTVASVVSALGAGQELDSAIHRLASEGGMEPELARQYVEEGVALYKDNLTRDLARSTGLDPKQAEDFYAFAADHPKLQRSLSELMHEGKTNTFRELAFEFKRQAGERTHAAMKSNLQRAGFESRVDRNGELLLRRGNGPWLSAAQLA